MKNIFSFILIFLCQIVLAQNKCTFYIDSILNREVYTETNIPTKFKGGDKEYSKYMIDNIKPKTVTESQTKIRFYLIINKKGNVIYVGFYKKLEYYSSIPDQIKKAFLNKKQWSAAQCENKKVLFRFEGVFLL